MLEFFNTIIAYFQKHNIPYMLSGSVAMSIYITPRATRDFDFIIHLQENEVPKLVEHFKEGYYCDKDAIIDAIQNKGIFNIIDHKSGFKADFVILKDDIFRQTEFNRKVQTDFFNIPIFIVTAEDLLLSKLIWIQDLQSAIQMEDIKNIAELENLDWKYINKWIILLNLNTFNLINND